MATRIVKVKFSFSVSGFTLNGCETSATYFSLLSHHLIPIIDSEEMLVPKTRPQFIISTFSHLINIFF